MLDIGCAAGFSLIAARERGWEAEGIECSEFCVQYARSRGLTVHQGSLHDYPGKNESMDAITMWDYLEHSPDPLGDLEGLPLPPEAGRGNPALHPQRGLMVIPAAGQKMDRV